TGNFVVAIQINSWDSNGDLICSITHDFQIIVMSCTNTPPANPAGGIQNFSGTGNLLGPNTVGACYGDLVCFDVVFSDLVDLSDNITIQQDGTTLLPGATFVQTGTNPAVGTFCWTAQPGYTGSIVTFVAEDDGCPVMGTSGFAVNFNIATGVYAGPDPYICGTQSTTLVANGATSYVWSPANGLSCTNCANPVATPATTTTYTLTGNLAGSCPNVDQITVNVVPDFPLTMTPISQTICANEIAPLNASGSAGQSPYTYVWSPSATLNDPFIGNPLANPITTTTYTATVTSAAGCTKSATTDVVVTGVGPTVTIVPSVIDICAGEVVPFTATSEIIPVACGISAGCTGTNSNVIIGTGTASTTTYSPFYGSTVVGTDYTKKIQYIYTAAELNAMGYTGGTIRNIALYVTTTNTYQYDQVKIWMGCTSLDQFANNNFVDVSTLTQVFGNTNNVNPTNNGWHTFNITDWDWDGTSNLIIQFCAEEDGAGNVGSNSVRYTSTSPAYRCNYDYSATVASCNEVVGTRSLSRANMRFNICSQTVSSPTYTWTPGTGLNNTGISNPTATPGASTSYVLNVTDAGSGCTGSAIAQVNVSPDYTVNPVASPISLCYGASTDLAVNPSGPGPYAYVWTPGGAFVNPTDPTPTVTPTGQTTYYIECSNGFCNKFDSITVSVAGLPVTAIVSQDTVCPNTPVNITTVAAAATCGLDYSDCTGTSSNAVTATGTSATSTYGPFYGSTSTSTYTNRKQYIVTADELTTMGFTAGMITELAFDVSTSTGRSYDDLTIWIGCTSLTQFPNTSFVNVSTMSQVYYNGYYTTQNGWNSFDITGYNWDGSSNIIIQFCAHDSDQTGSESVRYTLTTPLYKCLYYNSSSVNACSNATGIRNYNRPNIRFTMCANTFGAGSTYSWTPGTNLSDPNISNPIANVLIDQIYNLTVVDPLNPGCPSNAVVQVAIDQTNSVSAIPDTLICPGDVVDLDAQFSGPIPTTIPCGANGTSCSTPEYNTTWGTSTSSGCCPTIYYGSQTDMRTQMLYRASDLIAMGMSSGTISQIGWNVVTKTSTGPYQNFTIKMACTNLTALTTTYTNALTTVKNAGNVTTAVGWNMHTLDNPYDWDGVSNLIVDVCYDNPAAIGYDYTSYSAAGYTALIRSYNSTNTTSGCAYTGNATYSYSNLATTRFRSCDAAAGVATYLWTPVADLNNPNIANPTVTPAASGTTTSYLVEVVGGVCTVYDTVNVTTNCTALPVELLNFSGFDNNGVNELNWITVTELNNDHFVVQRSSDGLTFETLGKVNGAGTTIEQQNYRYLDHSPNKGINYYRLKQIDYDGTQSLSETIAISGSSGSDIQIFPNPTTNDLFIELVENGSNEKYTVLIVDITGKTVSQALQVSSGQQVYKVEGFKILLPGMYIIKVLNAQLEMVKMERISKQ
ncbi:MAG: T9SS type A sorting domain-containing protein, partial [Crocinitomicaceae bacterium]|nr:T9SS type A sorting domain-containing protein [Crocinitomicaceae bacterium]